MLGISDSPLSLVYHLENKGPSTAQADATVTLIPEGNFCHYMCNHFSALGPTDIPTFGEGGGEEKHKRNTTKAKYSL